MTCRNVSEYNGKAGRQKLVFQTASGPVYAPFATEAECLAACKEGACCEGTTCTVKPACQCQGAGKTFKGVGTTCAGISGACCEDGPAGSPPTCSIKTSCECVGNGKTFKGVGSTCADGTCCKTCTTSCQSPMCIPRYVVVSFSATTQEYVAYIFNQMCRVPALTFGGSATLSGYYNTEYPCGRYIASFEGSAASLFNGSAVYVQAGPGGIDGYVRVRKKAEYGSTTGGITSLSLTNEWPIVPNSQYVEFTFRFSSSPSVSGGVLQNGAGGYCYGGGTSPLMWVQYGTSGEFETNAGNISVTSSYGAGVPLA